MIVLALPEYTAIMLKTFLWKWLLFAILAPFGIGSELIYMHSKRKMTKAENRRRQQMNNEILLLLIGIAIYSLIESVPILKDCIEKNYTSVYGEYTIETAPASKSGISPTEWVVITTDNGERIVLDYPRGKVASELPDDTCYGTALYAENSHYILEFIPDEPTDGD